MAIFSDTNVPAANGSNNGKAKVKSKLWLNPGRPVQIQNTETGEMEDVFVTLPYGIPVDTMEESSVDSKNANWVNRMSANNAFLRKIKAIGDTLKPGESKIISGTPNGIQLQLLRIAENAPVSNASENPYLAALDFELPE